MIRSLLRTAVFFGCLIGLVLLAMQYGRLLLWPWRPIEGYATLVGVVFLAAGIALGVRLSRRERAVAAPEPDSRAQSCPPVDSPLSPRESEILLALAEGCSNSEIAERHFVSVNTVKTHVRQIYGKLGVRRRGQAVARARDLGLLP